ncbi:MAG: radical SAM protein, partial [Deltaproteobacteria bacterium]|nr:radical SAM protein [Deltaproteobacteria bacterium]
MSIAARYNNIEIPNRIVCSQSTVRHVIGATLRDVAMPVTFTPFASVEPCTARCRFCSEALVYKHSTRLSATLRPASDYGRKLRRVLAELRGLRVGLSLSGLEATSNSEWLLDVLAAAEEHVRSGGEFVERVLYSNGTGLAEESSQDSVSVLHALQRIALTRVEMSRHSLHQERNDAIMRFNAGVAIRSNDVFERTVR